MRYKNPDFYFLVDYVLLWEMLLRLPLLDVIKTRAAHNLPLLSLLSDEPNRSSASVNVRKSYNDDFAPLTKISVQHNL